jgi:hypothetical protein
MKPPDEFTESIDDLIISGAVKKSMRSKMLAEYEMIVEEADEEDPQEILNWLTDNMPDALTPQYSDALQKYIAAIQKEFTVEMIQFISQCPLATTEDIPCDNRQIGLAEYYGIDRNIIQKYSYNETEKILNEWQARKLNADCCIENFYSECFREKTAFSSAPVVPNEIQQSNSSNLVKWIILLALIICIILFVKFNFTVL